MNVINTSAVDLNLGGHSGQSLFHPRHLLLFDDCILAYGGDTGVLTAVPLSTVLNAPDRTNRYDLQSSNRIMDGNSQRAQVVARFDEPIRAVAISPDDGRRIAFGFEDGSTLIYSFIIESRNNSEKKHHPFLESIHKRFGVGQDEENGDYDDMFLSQENPCFSSMAGPRFEAPIRCLEFHPCSSKNRGYFLAIASESSPGLSLIRLPNNEENGVEEDFKTYLREEGGDAHDMSGLRSLSFSTSSSMKKTFLSTLGMDGRMCLWDVSGLEDPGFMWELLHRDAHKIISKPDVGEWNGATVADRVCSPAWAYFRSRATKEQDNIMLGLPGKCDLQLRINCGNDGWEKKTLWITTTASDAHSSDIITLAFEPMSEKEMNDDKPRMLISSDRDGKFCLWEIVKTNIKNDGGEESDIGRFIRCLNFYPDQASVRLCTQILWFINNDNRKVLCFAQEDGKMNVMVGVDALMTVCDDSSLLTTSNAVALNTSQNEASSKASNKQSNSSSQGRIKNVSKQMLNQESDDEVDFGSNSNILDHGLESKKQAASNPFIDDEAEENDEQMSSNEDDKVEFDDFIVKDDFQNSQIVEAMMEKTDLKTLDEDNQYSHKTRDEDDDDDDEEEEDNYLNNKIRAVQSFPVPQAPFAPSSTPLGFKQRILCWNFVGLATSRADDDGNNMIEISFTDAAAKRPVSFRDNMNFIVGSLGEDGGIFASDIMELDEVIDDNVQKLLDDLHGISDETKAVVKRSERRKIAAVNNEKPTGSCVFFYRFETFGSLKEKDWQVILPNDERAVGCACGEGWAAVITNRRFLRLFSSGGIQGPVTWLKGDPVTVVGRGRYLAVLYHESNPLFDGTQKLGYSLHDAFNGTVISTGSVDAISSLSSLTWAGFSNDFSLFVKDSDGMLSMLSCYDPAEASSWVWTPILDTVSLKKSSQDIFWPVTVESGKLICLHLKGGEKHPDPFRRPLTTALDLRLPLAGSSADKGLNLEEVSVRANIALRQKKFINSISIKGDPEECADIEAEYDAMAAQVDKVSLKLFIMLAENGKVERALDVIRSLHVEKSYDIAVTVSDRLGLRKLSDRILSFKEKKFSVNDEEDLHGDVFDSHLRSNEARQTLHEDYSSPRRISPDIASNARTLKRLEHSTNDTDEIVSQNDATFFKRRRQSQEETTKNERHDSSAAVVDNDSAAIKKKRFVNPFAKKHIESPVAPSSPIAFKSPNRKPLLQRNSTFSAQSRELSKVSKRIL